MKRKQLALFFVALIAIGGLLITYASESGGTQNNTYDADPTVTLSCDIDPPDNETSFSFSHLNCIPQSIIGSDDRTRVTDTTSYPWCTICKVYSYHPSGRYAEGTAFMVDENHVLTAGHLVYLHDENGWSYDSWADSIKVVPGMNNGNEPYGHAWATNMRSTTGYTEQRMREHDWALITLDSDIGSTTGWMGIQTAHYTDPIYTGTLNTAGYPGDLDDGLNMYRCSGSGKDADTYIHYYYLDTWVGQSGSPVWRYDGSDRYVLTVHTAETDSYNLGTRLNNDKYDTLNQWLEEDSSSAPETVYVDDDFDNSTPGWTQNHFDVVQDGIDAVAEDGTVYVYNGTYYENVVINKKVDLIGENRTGTVVDGGGTDDVVYVAAAHVNISCCTVTGGGSSGGYDSDAGIDVRGDYCNVSNCRITDNGNKGILTRYCSHCSFYNDEFSNNPIGVIFRDSSYYHVVRDCVFKNNSYGLQFGGGSSHHFIENCFFKENSGDGIRLRMGCNYNTIHNCFISNTTKYGGITFHGSGHHNAIKNCTISSCQYGFYSDRPGNFHDNDIYHNNIINNTIQTTDMGDANWDNGYPSGGNYWSDYDEPSEGAYDNNSDGIVDSPYDIPGGEQDLYPLMEPWNTTPSTVYVDDDYDASIPGWQIDHFDVIQDGIDAVAENGEVHINNGTYNENVVVDKTIDLIGEDRHETIIDGKGGRCIWLKVNGINVSHFSIKNSTNGGIVIDSDYNHIFCCNIFDQKQAIGAGYTSHNQIIKCDVYNCSTAAGAIGLAWDNHYTKIINCTIHDNDGHGLKITTPSSHLNVINCSVYNNSRAGLDIQDTSDSLVSGCEIHDNEGIAIAFSHWSGSGSNNVVKNNTLANNTKEGILFDADSDDVVVNNTIISNSGYGIYISSTCDNIKVYHNNFIDNNAGGVQGYDAGTANTWYNATLKEGNYWSDYNGTDTNGDDIGDVPYNIAGAAENQDLYPLLYSYGPPYAAFIYTITEKQAEFNASLSGDYNGAIVSYTWDFGDGTSGTGMAVEHTYSDYGTYNVTLTVIDNKGHNNSISMNIATEDLQPPNISQVEHHPENQESGRWVNITFNVTDNWAVDTLKINITHPDGESENITIPTGRDYYNTTYNQLGSYYYYIWANDTSHNTCLSDTYSFTVQDTIKPSSSVDMLSSFWQTSTPFIMTAMANDSGSGVSTVELFYNYSEHNESWSTWTSLGIDKTYPYQWSFNSSLPDGYYRFYSVATDNADNTENPPQPYDILIGVDTAPPSSTVSLSGIVGNNNWYVSPVECKINVTDAASGINQTKYNPDGEGWINYLGPFTLSGEGLHTLSFYSVDNAGNVGAVNSTSFKIDTKPPETTLEYDTMEDNLSVSLTASDAQSGVNQTEYALNNDDWHTYTHSFSIPRTQNYSIYYRSIDNASNQEETHLFKLIHPIANFEWSPDIPNVSENIEFTDYSNDEDGNIVNYTWDFGDGNTSYEQHTPHTYTQPGEYTISLRVTDNDNMTNTIQKTITVNKIPVSNFSYNPSSPKTDATITFDGSTSTDIDGTIAEYMWDWDNDGIYETSGDSATATHSWSDNGTYNVTLKVTDDKGANDIRAQTIMVANRAPVTGFSFSPQNPKPGESISFASSCYDQDGSIVAYDWNLGISTSSATNPKCTYQNSGVYTISLTVEDDDGATDTISRTINVNELPTAGFTCSPSNPTDLETISFIGSSTDVDGAISSYNWNFGDNNDSQSQNPSHQYADNGTYTITLTVEDDDGSTDTTSKDITVKNVEPTANFTYTPQSPIKVDSTLNFTDNSSDSDGTIENCSWTFGDATTGYGQTTNHTYTAPGTYNVTLTATDNDGDTDSYIKSVEIKAPSKDEDGTPGFGLALLIMAIAAILLVKRRKG